MEMQNKITFIQRCINKLNRIINPEKQFYVDLFINHPDWNKREPNGEELNRWKIIKKFMDHVESIDTTIGNGAKILDIGCGRGWLSNLLSQYGTVTGLEPNGSVVNHANKLFPQLNIKAGTAKKILHSHKECFDIIISSEVIEHIPDDGKEDFANDIKMLSKKDSYLIITTPRKEAQAEWMKYQAPSQPVEEWMTENQVENLFQSNGWRTMQKDRFCNQPKINGPDIEIYQLWLFKRDTIN